MKHHPEVPGRARTALKPIEKVVVGSSLEAGSDVVMRAAVDVTRAVGGRLAVVHSLPLEAALPRLGMEWQDADYYRKWVVAQRQELASQVERLEISVPVSSHLETGAPYKAILGVAERAGADLIVIGAADRGRLERFLGGTADRVLRRARCPVLVVRDSWQFPSDNVLAPVDFSILSADALECGLNFLLQVGVEAPRVELLHVLDELQQALAEPFSKERLKVLAGEELARFGRRVEPPKTVKLSARVAFGRPATEILREAERFETDLIVLGTHGHGGFEQALLGSVARAVATAASGAILFIPPETSLGASVAEAVLEQTEPRWGAEAPGANADSARREV